MLILIRRGYPLRYGNSSYAPLWIYQYTLFVLIFTPKTVDDDRMKLE